MAHPQFPTVRRGYEPRAVEAALDDLRDQITQAEATAAASRQYAADLLAELQRLEALEYELTTSLDLARKVAENLEAEARSQAAAILSRADMEAGGRLAVAELEASACTTDARNEADRLLAEGRARLEAEAAEMERYRMAIVAEASMLAQIERRLGPQLSRAAARLIEVVDAPDGLGPFSKATASLVEVARLLQRAAHAGTLEAVSVEVTGGNAVLRIETGAIDLRQGPPMVPIGQEHGTLPALPGLADLPDAGTVPVTGSAQHPADDHENARNISSMALS